jgi:hypothetical protein
MRRETTRTHPSVRAVYARSRVAAGGWNPQNLGDCDTVYARPRVAPQSVSMQVVIRSLPMTRPASSICAVDEPIQPAAGGVRQGRHSMGKG